MEALVFAGAALLVLLLVGLAGHRMLTSDNRVGGGAADALGNFIDVFDPARARADRDLKSKEHQGEVAPSPDDEDPPVRIDPLRMRATIRRAAPPTAQSGPPEPHGPPPRPARR